MQERTFDESGHYTVDEFELDILESLNDRIDNDGLFLENETTEQRNTPSDDLCVSRFHLEKHMLQDMMLR